MEIRTPDELAAQWERTPCVIRRLLPSDLLRPWSRSALERRYGTVPLLVRMYSPSHHHGMTPWSEAAMDMAVERVVEAVFARGLLP